MFYFTCNTHLSKISRDFYTPGLLSKTIATYVHVYMKANPYSLIFPMNYYLKQIDFTVAIKKLIKL